MLDTYPTSAFDPLGFFDVKALFPYVDELFVMAYDMQDPGVASATAPLTNAPFSDATTLAEYAAVVPARRIVLGIPLYGYDFPASSRFDGAMATGPPLAVTYAAIVAAGHRAAMGPGDRDSLDGVQKRREVAPDLVRRSRLHRPQVCSGGPVRLRRRRRLGARDVGQRHLDNCRAARWEATAQASARQRLMPALRPQHATRLVAGAQVSSAFAVVIRAMRRTKRDLRRDAWLA